MLHTGEGVCFTQVVTALWCRRAGPCKPQPPYTGGITAAWNSKRIRQQCLLTQIAAADMSHNKHGQAPERPTSSRSMLLTP